MKFLKNIFGGAQEEPKKVKENITLSEFWSWFEENESRFLHAVKTRSNIEFDFITPVFKKLNQVKEGAFLLTGMMDEHKAELIFTAQGNLLFFPYIEEIVHAAPKLDHWQFTAFKPSMDSPDFGIRMGPKNFGTENIQFYAEVDPSHPDEINIKLVFTEDYRENERDLIEHGLLAFLDNYLGEVKAATQIDQLSIAHAMPQDKELIPITKLNDYINWREKEFEEKYEGIVHNTEDSNYTSLEWENEGRPIVGVVNTDLIRWDSKASHPWVMIVAILFDENENNGMPNQEALQSYYEFEDELRALLPDSEGYLHVAQTTGLGRREIYYANKDFMKPIQVLEAIRSKVEFTYEIEVFKDKYWQSMRHFEH